MMSLILNNIYGNAINRAFVINFKLNKCNFKFTNTIKLAIIEYFLVISIYKASRY